MIPKLTAQIGEGELPMGSMRVEVWVALPRTRRRNIRDCRNPSSPSVSGQPRPESCTVHVHARTSLTEPSVTWFGSNRVRGEGSGQGNLRSRQRKKVRSR